MTAPAQKPFLPLYVQILIAVGLGITVGLFFGKDSAHYIANESMGEIGFAIIRLLKILAIPLIFFAIIDTILKTEITGNLAIKVISICLFNVSVAMIIGLLILNIFTPGKGWQGRLNPDDKPAVTSSAEAAPEKNAQEKAIHDKAAAQKPDKLTLNPIQVFTKLVPDSVIEPFVKNNTIGVIIIALLFGFAFRGVKRSGEVEAIENIEKLADLFFKTTLRVIGYVIKIIPIGVFCLVGQAVGKSGLGVFAVLWIFLITILAGFLIHSFIYYPLVAWIVGKKSPRVYLGMGADAILTGFSANSSLATVPLTLKTLTEKMGVSDASARLSACFATNLNNDGITLYEAMTALFLTQALGFDLPISSQIFIVLISIFVSMGIAGIPEAGLIILPLVLSASGLSDQAIALSIALIVPIDWFIARLRSAVNVMSDMVVAIILDKV